MPNTELLIKEAEGLPPEYFAVVLNLIRSLKQATAVSPTAAPVPCSHKEAIEECWGLAKRMGFTFSSDQLLENRRKGPRSADGCEMAEKRQRQNRAAFRKN